MGMIPKENKTMATARRAKKKTNGGATTAEAQTRRTGGSASRAGASTSSKAREKALARAYAKGRQESGGASFHKLEVGDNIFHVVGANEGPDHVVVNVHGGQNSEGRFLQCLDLSQAFNPQDASHQALASKITEDDATLYAEYGDPCLRLEKALLQEGWDREAIREKKTNPLRRTRVLWNVVSDGQVKLWESSWTQRGEIIDYEEYADGSLFDPTSGLALKITGSGSGFSRRYKAPKIVKRKLDISGPLQTYDLRRQVAKKYLGYRDKVAFVFRSYPGLITAAKLDHTDFGVDSIEG